MSDITFDKEKFIGVFTHRIYSAAHDVRFALEDADAFRAYCYATKISSLAENLMDITDDPNFVAHMYSATLELEKAMRTRLGWESRTPACAHWACRIRN